MSRFKRSPIESLGHLVDWCTNPKRDRHSYTGARSLAAKRGVSCSSRKASPESRRARRTSQPGRPPTARSGSFAAIARPTVRLERLRRPQSEHRMA